MLTYKLIPIADLIPYARNSRTQLTECKTQSANAPNRWCKSADSDQNPIKKTTPA
jgi:antitoxin (DNA-binding transcriptional repressor) of toxin-antitoxin stability system